MRRRIDVTDLDLDGATLDDDRLARVAGGMRMNAEAPTMNTSNGHFDAPGTEHLTRPVGADVSL